MKLLRKISIFPVLWLILCTQAAGQKNTEALRRYYEETGWFNNIQVGVDYKSGNSNHTTIDVNFRSDYAHPLFESFLSASVEYKKGESEMLADNGFMHLRGKVPLNYLLAMEAFVQKEYDDFILLNDRNLIGGGARIMPVQIVLDTLGRKFEIHIGIGFMYENEVYATDPITRKNRIRSTNYLNLKYNITPEIDLYSTTYYQINAVELDDYRLFNQTILKINIIGSFSLVLDVTSQYNNKPVGNIKNFDFRLKNAISYDFEL